MTSLSSTPVSATRIQSGRLASLDLLRFVAAVAVMLYHYTYSRGVGGASDLTAVTSVSRLGFLGVEVFFMISGFVILWSASGRTAGQFVRSRVLRLYPEFWIAVLVTVGVRMLWSGPGGSGLAPGDVVRNLTMIPGYLGAPYVDGVYWTLEVEIRFYALIFLLIIARQMSRIETWLYVWLVLVGIATVVETSGPLKAMIIFPYGALFASGGIFFLIYSSGWTPTRALAVVVGLVLSAYHATGAMEGFVYDAHITTASQFATVCVLTATFGLFALLGRVRLSNRVATHAASIGVLTYPLYLLHNTGKELFIEGRNPFHIGFACAYSLLVAWLVTHLARKFVAPHLRWLLDHLERLARACLRRTTM